MGMRISAADVGLGGGMEELWGWVAGFVELRVGAARGVAVVVRIEEGVGRGVEVVGRTVVVIDVVVGAVVIVNAKEMAVLVPSETTIA